jgi:hypothetical protein
MTFVYTGKGRRGAQKDGASLEQKNCTKQACAIQWCIAKRGNENFCQSFIDNWKTCVDKAKAAEAEMKIK